jgi:hypothetical protein
MPTLRRDSKAASQIFQQVLKQAAEQLSLDARVATSFENSTIRGDERASALRRFLADHLPGTLAVGTGEAIDYADARTGQLDLCIYDRSTASPIQASGENVLIPAEALYAVVEVKSVLSQSELTKCVAASAKVRSLRPFKQGFSSVRSTREASANYHRCPYIVFAYTTDLGGKDWPEKEFGRVKIAALEAKGDIDLLDQIIVLDRGLINPRDAVAIEKAESTNIFLEFYIHLMNFLMREKNRRPPIDWLAYTRIPPKKAWLRLV